MPTAFPFLLIVSFLIFKSSPFTFLTSFLLQLFSPCLCSFTPPSLTFLLFNPFLLLTFPYLSRLCVSPFTFLLSHHFALLSLIFPLSLYSPSSIAFTSCHFFPPDIISFFPSSPSSVLPLVSPCFLLSCYFFSHLRSLSSFP